MQFVHKESVRCIIYEHQVHALFFIYRLGVMEEQVRTDSGTNIKEMDKEKKKVVETKTRK